MAKIPGEGNPFGDMDELRAGEESIEPDPGSTRIAPAVWLPTGAVEEMLPVELVDVERPPRLVFYKSFGKYRFRVVGANNEKMAQSQGYKELRSAEETARKIVRIPIWTLRRYDLSIQKAIIKQNVENSGADLR